MSTLVNCPSCGHECQVPDRPASEVKCPDCGRVLDAAAVAAVGSAESGRPDAVAPPVAPPAPITTEPSPPLSPITEPPRAFEDRQVGQSAEADELMPCPHCGERIRRNSTFCRFCREHVEEETLPWERPGGVVRRDVNPHRGNLILVLGILGFVIPLVGLGLAIAAWVMGRRDMARMDRREMDPQGRGITQAGFICGIIATVLQGLLLLGCVAYIVMVILIMSILFRSMPPARPMVPVAPPPPPRPVPGKAWQMPGGALRLQDYLPCR